MGIRVDWIEKLLFVATILALIPVFIRLVEIVVEYIRSA